MSEKPVSTTVHIGDTGKEKAPLCTIVEKGIYWETWFLGAQLGGILPLDPERIRRIIGVEPAEWAAAWPMVETAFPVVDGRRIHQATLDDIEFRRSRRQAGQQGGLRPHPTQRSSKRRAEVEQTSSRGRANVEQTNEQTAEQKSSLPLPLPLRDPSPDPSPSPSPSETDTCPAGGPSGVVGLGDEPVLHLVEAKKAKPDSPANVWAVFRHFFQKPGHVMRRNPKPESKTWRAVAARLRGDWTVQDLCKAIDGYHLSPYHLGQNDKGTKYLDLELFVRSDEHVEKGINFAENPPKPANPTGRIAAEACRHDIVGEITI